MITVKYENGYTESYDETFVPGDLITGYQSGYHEFVEYQHREGGTPIVHFKKRYREDGTAIKSRKLEGCDAAYCQRAKDRVVRRIQLKEREIAALQKILNDLP